MAKRRTLIYMVELEANLDGEEQSLGITINMNDMIIETVIKNGRADKTHLIWSRSRGSNFISKYGYLFLIKKEKVIGLSLL